MKQMNRKNLILIGVAAVALIAAVIAILYFTLWIGPSKQDFADGKEKAEKISTYSGSELLSTYTSKISEGARTGLTQQKLADSAADEKKKLVEAITARETLAKELSGSRVVRDEDVKKAYDTYSAKETKYRTYMLGYADAFAPYRSSFATCIKTFQINDGVENDVTVLAGRHRTAAKPCLEDLAAVAKSPVTPLADYAKEFTRIINERQKVFDGLEKKTLDTDKAGERIKELGADYTKNDPITALQKYVGEARFDGELNALIKLLDDKAKAAK